MPSYKKMLRMALERAKLIDKQVPTVENVVETTVRNEPQVSFESLVADESICAEPPFLESGQKSPVLEEETVVSPISQETPIPAVLSEKEASPGQDAGQVRDGLKSEGTGIAEPRFCRVYGKPINPRIRFIEFEDGSHGKLWVHQKAAPMVGWTVWVLPYVDVPGDWVMHGRYNSMGVRRS